MATAINLNADMGGAVARTSSATTPACSRIIARRASPAVSTPATRSRWVQRVVIGGRRRGGSASGRASGVQPSWGVRKAAHRQKNPRRARIHDAYQIGAAGRRGKWTYGGRQR